MNIRILYFCPEVQPCKDKQLFLLFVSKVMTELEFESEMYVDESAIIYCVYTVFEGDYFIRVAAEWETCLSYFHL